MNRKFFIFILLFFAVNLYAVKKDAYDKLAKELSESASLLEKPKVAILPFSYADGRKSPGGNIVSERLTTRIVKLKKLQVIERQLLDKVIQELHLETTGVVDAETTKQLGKVLGVDAIITGSLVDIGNNKVEVNARVIKTDTAEVITTASGEIDKIWIDVLTGPPFRQVKPRQPLYQPVVTQPVQHGLTVGFIDFFIGQSGGKMDLTFESDSYSISEIDLNLDLDGSGTLDGNVKHSKISFKDLDTENVTIPIGLRIGNFSGKNLIGFDFGIFYLTRQLTKQKTSVTYDDIKTYNFLFYRDGYIKVNVFAFYVDLLLRFPTRKVLPYVGIGLGFSINRVYSKYIYQYTTTWKKPLDELSLGFLWGMPFGIRVILNEQTSLFGEFRIVHNNFIFNRGVSSETNNITLSLPQFLFGVGFHF